MTDTRIGKTLTVVAPHAGHTLTVEKRDEIEKHQAYWLVCECGARTAMGIHWLDLALKRGSVGHEIMGGI